MLANRWAMNSPAPHRETSRRGKTRATAFGAEICLLRDLEFFYQPIVAVQPRGVQAFEALLRWRHPSGALLAPAFFLDRLLARVAPGELAAFTIRRIVETLKALRWSTRMHVAINLSPEQLLEGTVPDLIAGIYDADLFQLEVEVTEQPIRDLPRLARILRGLRELGVKVSLDDITLSTLGWDLVEALELDGVKLDSSLLVKAGVMLEDDLEQQRVLKSFIAGLKRRGLSVTAEGVNTPFESDFLVGSGVDHLQGFKLGGPMSFREVAAHFGGALPAGIEHSGGRGFIYLLTGTEGQGDGCREHLRAYVRAQGVVSAQCSARNLGHRATLR